MQDIFLSVHAHVMDPDRIPYLTAAIFLTMTVGMVTGPVAGNANSFLWGFLGFLFGRVGDRLDRVARPRSDLLFRGFVFSSVLLLLMLLLGRGMTQINNAIVELGVVSLCLTSGSVWYILLKLYFALEKNGHVSGAYFGLSRSARVDLNSTDDFGIVREGLGYSAVSFDKGVVAPSLWYLIGGIPALLIYSAVSFSAWRFGKSGFTKGFGSVPIALEKIMGFVPSLFTGFLFSIASALTPTAQMRQTLSLWWKKKGHAPYEEGGIVLSAVAWPLGVSLGGPVRDISGASLNRVWVGSEGASAQLNYKQLRRGIFMNVTAHVLFIVALLMAYIYAGRMF